MLCKMLRRVASAVVWLGRVVCERTRKSYFNIQLESLYN